ncbi:MAG: alpha/beta fold hydrolase [candidate division Zixibacteria bacterium]|nr:alpha/beta fold hydrolase [candidate division Zixibacteria bacterium]
MTKKTREAVKATLAIILVVILIFVLWIYPLNQAGKIVSRPEGDTGQPTASLPGVVGDTLTVISEDNQKLAGILFKTSSPKGTFVLVHGLFGDRNSQLEKAKMLVDSGFDVMVYDQRGYGQSEGKYRSGGYYEAEDVQEVVSLLDLKNLLIHPVIIWGEDQGATAAFRAWPLERRIDFVVAENLVANGHDWQKRVIRKQDMSAPDLLLPVVWWWMKLKSSYEISAAASEIGEQYDWAVTNKAGKFIVAACGTGQTPDNNFLAALKNHGGNWMILPCADASAGGGLYGGHKDALLSAITAMIGGK